MKPAGMLSLAVYFPEHVRTNDHFRRTVPDMVERAEARCLRTPWNVDDPSAASRDFDAAALPFMGDPFRGSKERRIMSPEETALSMELRVAREALACAGIGAGDVDAALVSSFPADQPGVGNGAFLASELGLKCGAWNVESACNGSLAAYAMAAALVEAGRAERVLVVVSCAYSRVFEDRNILAWTIGDGATAFVVGREREGRGLLGYHGVHTGATCGAFYYEMVLDERGRPKLRVDGNKAAGNILRDTSERYVRECCEGAVRAAGMTLADVDWFVFNTPVAWFASFATRVLGVPRSRTVQAFPYCGNVGPVLTNANLYLSARAGHIKPGDRVLVYAIGSSSSASAALVRWGDVRLGEEPPGFLATCGEG